MGREDLSELVKYVKGYLMYLKELSVDSIPLPENKRYYSLNYIKEEINECKRCKLKDYRKNIVFGKGNEKAKLMLIGEAPGNEEDIRGEPFVGMAGELLTKMLKAIDLNREDVYITNVVKCHPPKNRNPAPDEIEACKPFLVKQIEAIKPKIIWALGSISAKTLLNSEKKISELRGKLHRYNEIIKLIPTYHPAFLLRNPYKKREAWEDIKMIKKELL
jgi:DNA polymerase